ncbi:MAG: phosphodiester glycosidase family protein [Nitrospira sp.]|nr:phosphodiester glycosidase family protein [Nitrospira sp.]
MDFLTTQPPHRSCRIPRAFFIALLLWATTPVLAQEPRWESLAPGLAAAIWQPDDRCLDSDRWLVVKIDPALHRFSVHYFAQEGLPHPPMIDEWQKRTGHEILFNAGLFRENYAYLGLLLKDGKSLGSRRHNTWQGLFVAEPRLPLSAPKAGVLDLASDIFHEETPDYLEAAQSLMLLDRKGALRVRQTGKRAYQTLVAENKDGHILILKSLGLVTLHGIGQCLRETFPSIALAMAMDGGSSSDLFVSESLWKRGDPSAAQANWKDLFAGRSTAHIPLPAVIGLSPRGSVTDAAPSSKP